MAGDKKTTQVIDRAGQVREVLRLMEEEGITEHKACEVVGIARTTYRINVAKYADGADYARAWESLGEDQITKMEKILIDLETGRIDAVTAKVMLDGRKWFASKFLPRKYGDKLDLTTDGKEIPAPITAIQINAATTPKNVSE